MPDRYSEAEAVKPYDGLWDVVNAQGVSIAPHFPFLTKADAENAAAGYTCAPMNDRSSKPFKAAPWIPAPIDATEVVESAYRRCDRVTAIELRLLATLDALKSSLDAALEKRTTVVVDKYVEAHRAMMAERDAATARAERAEGALAFYAIEDTWNQSHGPECRLTGDPEAPEMQCDSSCGWPEALRDNGAKARTALARVGKGEA